MPSHTR
jgi:hypothetical protein